MSGNSTAYWGHNRVNGGVDAGMVPNGVSEGGCIRGVVDVNIAGFLLQHWEKSVFIGQIVQTNNMSWGFLRVDKVFERVEWQIHHKRQGSEGRNDQIIAENMFFQKLVMGEVC